MKVPKKTVVKITTIRVVDLASSYCYYVKSSIMVPVGSNGIIITKANAIAPLIIPPYDMNSSSLKLMVFFRKQSLNK